MLLKQQKAHVRNRLDLSSLTLEDPSPMDEVVTISSIAKVSLKTVLSTFFFDSSSIYE